MEITLHPNKYRSMGFAVIDFNKNIAAASDTFAEVMGQDVSSIVGRPVLDVTAPEDRAETNDRLDDLISGKLDRVLTQKRYKTPAGHRKWCSLESVNHGTVLISLIYEIHEGETYDKVEQLERTVQALSDAVIRYQTKGVTVNANLSSNSQGNTSGGISQTSSGMPAWVIAVIVLAAIAVAGVSIQSEWFSANKPKPGDQIENKE